RPFAIRREGPGAPAAGAPSTLPSIPVLGPRELETSGERVLPGQQPVSERDLTPARDAQLLAQHVAVRLRRSRGDPELLADLVVREPLRDQLDDLALAIGDRVGVSEGLHRRRR